MTRHPPSSDPRQWRRAERRAAAFAFVAVVALLAAAGSTSVLVLSAARAYVTGESLYAKGQKTATRFLRRYLAAGDAADFARFRQALAVPLGDRRARLALEADPPDAAAARRGFLDGGNDPGDVEALVHSYRVFRHAPHVAEAIALWQSADAEIVELDALGERSRRLVEATPPDPAAVGAVQRRLDELDDVLTGQELAFTRQLGVAARWLERTLLVATGALSLVLAIAGVVFGQRVWRRLWRAQREVAEGNTRWALAADAGGFGLVTWDAGADIAWLDARAAAAIGLRVDDAAGDAAGDAGVRVPGPALRERVHEDDRAALRDAAVAAARSGGAMRIQFRLAPDGVPERHLELQARAVPGEPAAGEHHLVGLLRDVTADVLARQAKLAEDAALKAYEDKREFLSRVSHELRTPLNAVIGFFELMRMDRDDPLSACQAARLARVVDGGQYLLRLVNDLLDVARLEVGELAVALQPVGVGGALRVALGLLEPALTARGLALVFDADAAASAVEVLADPVRLQQVLMNLLSNAIKYNRPGGAVTVRVDVDAGGADAAEVAIEIRDEGVGMTELQQRELFIPFRRVGATASTTEGAGLGLVITRHLVERQGGRLEIRSAPRQGTTAVVRLLRAERGASAEVVARETAHAAHAREARGVVLYVEDDEVNVLLLEQYAKSLPGIRLVVARDGHGGLAAIAAERPDVVLLDMQLPDMNGLDVLARLRDRAHAHHPAPTVIALSADAMPDQVALALNAGAHAYWTKPLALARFRDELPRFL